MKKRRSRLSSARNTAGAMSSADFADALERKVDLEHAAEDLRLVDPDLRAGERMLAQLEHDPLIGADRLVARIALDVDEADGHPRLRLGRRGCATAPIAAPTQATTVSNAMAGGRLIIDHHAPGDAADRDRHLRAAGLGVDHRHVVAEAVGDEQRRLVAR